MNDWVDLLAWIAALESPRDVRFDDEGMIKSKELGPDRPRVEVRCWLGRFSHFWSCRASWRS